MHLLARRVINNNKSRSQQANPETVRNSYLFNSAGGEKKKTDGIFENLTSSFNCQHDQRDFKKKGGEEGKTKEFFRTEYNENRNVLKLSQEFLRFFQNLVRSG